MTVDHWEALFDRSYLRWFNLNGKPALVEIVKVEAQVEMTLPGGAKSKKPVIHLKQVQGGITDMKPLVLNATNGNSIANVHGVKPSQWAGKQIVLFQDIVDMFDKEQRQMVKRECIRIRATKTQKGGLK